MRTRWRSGAVISVTRHVAVHRLYGGHSDGRTGVLGEVPHGRHSIGALGPEQQDETRENRGHRGESREESSRDWLPRAGTDHSRETTGRLRQLCVWRSENPPTTSPRPLGYCGIVP